MATANLEELRIVNEAAAGIVAAYLEYAGGLVQAALARPGGPGSFREINDDLVLKPDELVDLVNRVQAALRDDAD